MCKNTMRKWRQVPARSCVWCVSPTIDVYICVLHHDHFRVPRLVGLVLNWVYWDLTPLWLISRVFHLLSSIKAWTPPIDLRLFRIKDLLRRRPGRQVGNLARSHVGKIG